MVNVIKGGGRAAPTLTMTECTPESRRYYSVYSVVPTYHRRGNIPLIGDIRRGFLNMFPVHRWLLEVFLLKIGA